jgi:3-(methylthio)propanoyl-CoA dehydrogenase
VSGYQAPLADIDFVLEHIVDLSSISKLNGFSHADPETVSGVLAEAGRFFSEVIAPTNRIGDQVGSKLVDGSVVTPPGFKEAYAKYAESGWAGVHMPEEWGGGGFPYAVGVVLQELFKSANMAFSLCPLLTQAAIDALLEHGSESQRATYLEKLVTGEWTGTMCLTEPHAGSDVGALSTRAIRGATAPTEITGQKIFITWGDQDLTGNIIHLVLARLPDAAPGTKGISLFVVPKFLDERRPQQLRDRLARAQAGHPCLPHLCRGLRGSGGNPGGMEHQGMRYMFTMMNAARLAVGVEGLAIAERAYQQAVSYALDRRQGRAIGADPGDSSLIVDHPDIRRSLMTMRAHIEAMRSLLYSVAATSDLERHADSEQERISAAERVALLTPVAKAWSTDVGVEMASLGVQIHGGMGYVEETGAAQHYRDIRIAPIYEGTNGIQAIDLVLRKLPLRDGAVARELFAEMRTTVAALDTDLVPLAAPLAGALDTLEAASDHLLNTLGEGRYNDALAGATPYLRMFGLTVGGWFMARSALTARSLLGRGDDPFLAAKLVTARFYCTQTLPQAEGLLGAVTSLADDLMVLDPGVLALR